MDLCETLNAKQNWERDLHDKLNNSATTSLDKVIILAKLVARMTKPVPREPILRYQTPFSQDIEGIDPSEKFTPPGFTLYDWKLDLRSHISHGK